LKHQQKRRDPRPLLPNHGPVVAVELLRDRLRLAGRLWDVSLRRACLCFRGA